MLFQAVCLASLVVFQFANSAPLQDEKIEPVKLSHFCVRTPKKGDEEDKSAILLIHGLGGSAHNWDGVWEVLALRTKRRVCAVDLRNHGDSPWDNKTDIATLMMDIEHFLDSENIQKVNLIGHSLGGKISMHYALTKPERINSIVIEDMRPNGVSEEGMKMVKMALQLLKVAIESVPEGSSEDEARKIIIDFFNTKLKEFGIKETIDERTAKILELRCNDGKCRYKMNLDLYINIMENPEQMLIQSSGLYNGPALFIYGKKSVFDIAGDKENILKLFPNAKLVGVEGAGHQIHGNSRQFTDEVIRFLNNLN